MKSDKRSFPVDQFVHSLVNHVEQDLAKAPTTLLYSRGRAFDYKKEVLNGLTKKFRWASTKNDLLDRNARSNFVSHCARLHSFWENDSGATFEGFDTCSQYARNLIEGILGDLDEESWFTECRNGTGTTIGTSFKDASYEAKFTFPITGTLQTIKLFERYLKWDTQLAEALYELNRYSDAPMFKVVPGSRFSTVPKDSGKNRNIAIEPTLNMFFQQGLMALLVKALKKVGLSLDTLPDEHKDFAYYASVSLAQATIDLKNASDSTHNECIRKLFPPSWFSALNLIRCDKIEIRKGEWMKLPIISTMGNATTFPMETLVFFALSAAAQNAWTHRDKEKSSHFSSLPDWSRPFGVSVYGDDIVVKSDSSSDVIKCLEAFGFEINKDKTFTSTYPFRESCGGDFFAGYDVRPLFLKRPQSDQDNHVVPWLYNIFNSLTKKYISYFGDHWLYYCQDTLQFILRMISSIGTVKIVPDNMPDTSGIVDPDIRIFLMCPAKWSPIYIDRHGTSAYAYEKFRYPFSRTPTNIEISYYRALHDNSREIKWVTKRQRGKWTNAFSIGSLQCVTTCTVVNGPWVGPDIIESSTTLTGLSSTKIRKLTRS